MFNDSHFENDWGIDITRASLWRVSVVTSRRRITSVALHTKTKASSRQLSGNSLFFHEDVLFEGRHRQGCCHRSEDLLYKIKFKKCTFCLVKSHVTRWRRGEVHVHHAYTPSCIYAIMHIRHHIRHHDNLRFDNFTNEMVFLCFTCSLRVIL